MSNLYTFTTIQEQDVEKMVTLFEERSKLFTNAYEITAEIKPRAKRSFIEQCGAAESDNDIFPMVKDFIKQIAPTLSSDARKAMKNGLLKQVAMNLYALGLGAYNIKHAENVFDYFKHYAAFKSINYTKLNDYGAFGDLVETCVHCLAMRRLWRVQLKNLHVSAIGLIDVQIAGNLFEIGHNGKSFTFSTPTDYMSGKYNSIAYGMFDDDMKQMICDLFINGKTFEGLSLVAQNLYVWLDKYEFYKFVTNISKSQTFVWKTDHAQIVYNVSKQKQFEKAVYEQNITTLYDYMNTLSENDFLV